MLLIIFYVGILTVVDKLFVSFISQKNLLDSLREKKT